MTKEILEKITKIRTPLDVSDISAEEKKKLMSLLADKGFTSTTFYLRFFQKGFDAWEILGVTECKKRFLELSDVAKALLEYVTIDENEDENENEAACTNENENENEDENGAARINECDKGYLYVLAMSDTPGVFYDCLRKTRLCVRFHTFMGELGMSPATVTKRFSEENWRPWETEGIRNVLEKTKNEE